MCSLTLVLMASAYRFNDGTDCHPYRLDVDSPYEELALVNALSRLGYVKTDPNGFQDDRRSVIHQLKAELNKLALEPGPKAYRAAAAECGGRLGVVLM